MERDQKPAPANQAAGWWLALGLKRGGGRGRAVGGASARIGWSKHGGVAVPRKRGGTSAKEAEHGQNMLTFVLRILLPRLLESSGRTGSEGARILPGLLTDLLVLLV